MHWIKPIYNGGVKNLVSNHQTIMVRSVMAKLYSTIMEQNISPWIEHHHKQALDQEGFRP